MSTSFNVHLIYGFPVPANYLDIIGRVGGHQVYLDEWLERERLRPAMQFNAGQSNGGDLDYLVGVSLVELQDCTRGRGYKRVDFVVPPGFSRVHEAAKLLGVSEKEICNYILGDAA